MGRRSPATDPGWALPRIERVWRHRLSRGGRLDFGERGKGGDREADRGGHPAAREAPANVVRPTAGRPADDFRRGPSGDPALARPPRRDGERRMNKTPINVQDSFFYNLRKDNTEITVRLTSGEERMGRLRRFDKFALVLEVEGHEEMIYKHAIASIRAESLPPTS